MTTSEAARHARRHDAFEACLRKPEEAHAGQQRVSPNTAREARMGEAVCFTSTNISECQEHTCRGSHHGEAVGGQAASKRAL
jgi:hypothetical protein